MSNPDWHYGRPERGDHIRVRRMGGIYSHHGIFISPDEVIHFSREDGASLSQAYVMKSDLKTFLAGGTLEVARYDDDEVYPVDDVVEYARSRVGDTGYNLIFDNCEHFAAESKIGEHRSSQVERASSVAKFVFNAIGGRTMGFFTSIVTGALGWIGGKLFGSSKKRPPAKSDQVKLAEIERDKQAKLAKIDADKSLALADKEIARAKIERDTKLKLAEVERDAQIEYLQVQTQARMAEAAQQAKFAEMEREWQLKLADKENERIGLMRDAQLDIIKAQTMSQIMIEQARLEGQMKLADRLVALQEKLSELAGQRLLIIASGKMQVVRDINKYYGEIGRDIEKRKTEYTEIQLPELLKILAQYEEGTPSFKLYYRQIEKNQDTEAQFLAEQMATVREQQKMLLEQAGMSEQKIIEQTGELIQIVAAGYMQSQVSDALPSGTNSELRQLPGVDDIKKLSGVTHETKRLPEPAAK